MLEKIVKSHCQVNLFLADFSNLEPLCTASYTSVLCALHKLNHTLVHTPCMHSTKVVNSIMVFQNGIQKGDADPLNVFDWVHSLCFIFSQGDLAWQYTVHYTLPYPVYCNSWCYQTTLFCHMPEPVRSQRGERKEAFGV